MWYGEVILQGEGKFPRFQESGELLVAVLGVFAD
jgi:hypothetical protein